MIDDGPPTVLIPARRILVVDDIVGPIRAGDHLLMVGNVIFAHDTSRPASPKMLADSTPVTKRSYTRRSSTVPSGPSTRNKGFTVSDVDVDEDFILGILESQGVMTSKAISDTFCHRTDTKTRGKVTRVLRALLEKQQIHKVSDDPNKLPQYAKGGNVNTVA